MDYYNYNTINIDTNRLISLGFTKEEISALTYVYSNGGKFTSQALQSYGYNYEQTKKIMYMYNICAGKIQIDSKEQMIKHLRKMFGTNYRISIQDLAISNITNVPRVAVVSNITQEPYSIWNSNRYKGNNALYKVVDVSGQKVTVETPRKPKLAYGAAKTIPGILDIKGVKANGDAVVVFDKKVCNLCNRFIVVASLRNPEFHYGKYEILCFEGTKLYVYVTNMGIKENVKYSGGNQRVYDYGLFPAQIKPKLDKVAKGLYQMLHGVAVQYNEPNSQYKVVEVHKDFEEDGGDITL